MFEKCQTQKFSVSEGKRVRSDKRPKQLSDFGAQLLEKQRIRFSYGIAEKQFRNYVDKAIAVKGVPTTEKIYELLESRLDNAVYRMGLAHTRSLARQIVSHGHMVVNGKRTTVPSQHIKKGDVITIREGSRGSVLFAELDKKLKNYTSPSWISFDPTSMEGKVVGIPKGSDPVLNFSAVLQFYSR